MKRFTLIILALCLFTIHNIWAEGGTEGGYNKIHPGVRIAMISNGYTFDVSNNLIGLRDYRIIRFPNEYQINTNPYEYDKKTIYVTDFDVNQWIDGNNALARTGSDFARTRARTLYPSTMNKILDIGAGGSINDGTHIYIKNIPDRFLGKISSGVQNAFLIYSGAQTFQMANGSSQIFPVFELLNLYDDVISSATREFNEIFDKGIYDEIDGYQYSKVNNRYLGRDIATKKELYEWDGIQWVLLGN